MKFISKNYPHIKNQNNFKNKINLKKRFKYKHRSIYSIMTNKNTPMEETLTFKIFKDYVLFENDKVLI